MDWSLAAFAAVNFAAASSGAVFKPGPWYAGLRKPGWTPPNWAFPLVWTVLFLMNIAAGWLVWRAAGWSAAPALAFYALALLLNAGWSALFFGLRRMRWALAEVGLLWLSLVAQAFAFAPHSTTAAWLAVPYLAWVTVAALLNRRIIRLNPGADAGDRRAGLAPVR